MHRAILAAAVLAVGCASPGARVSVSEFSDHVARRLLATLPSCSPDGLIESRRGPSGWYFEVPLELTKAGGRRAEIRVKPVSAYSSQVQIAVIHEAPRILVPNRRVLLREETAKWVQFVKDIAAGAQDVACPTPS